MANKNKTTVRIGGREYTMRGFESEEYIHKVAIYVDKKMTEINRCQSELSTSMALLLTAINLADEAIKMKEKLDATEKQVADMQEILEKNINPNKHDIVRKVRTSK